MLPKLAFDVANVAIFIVILVGVLLRRRRVAHVRVMWSCFAADVLMVLVIELQRQAIKQTMEQVRSFSDRLLSFHIAISVAALALWIAQLVIGRAILRGEPLRSRHRAVAWAFFCARLTNVITAFMINRPD